MTTARVDGRDLVDLTRNVAQRFPDRDAYVELDHRISYGGYDRAADGLATRFSELGVRKGDVVCLAIPTSIDYAICYQAALRLGAVTSGINLRLGPAEQSAIINQLEPTVTVVEDGVEDDVADDTVPTGNVGHLLSRSSLAASYTLDPGYAPPRLSLDDAVTVVWTSGTTDMPKGAVYDHGRLRAMAAAAGPMSRPGDRRIYPLPFAHSGYMTRLWDEISNGITCVITPVRWTAADSLLLIGREAVTVGQGVPTQWALMLRHPEFDSTDFGAMRIAAMGASAIPAALVREVQTRIGCPVVVRYTSTEACVTTSTSTADPAQVVASTVGKPVTGVEVELVDGDGRPVPAGEVGRLRCRSAAVMKGYWKDPERTAEVLGEDGWLTTGDLAYFDGDGNLRITGRQQDMYIRGGYNVYPLQVEETLLRHPTIAEVAIMGVPDPVLGEIGMAFVVPRAGNAPTIEDLREWTSRDLADYKAPDRLILTTSLPRNAMGKLDRRRLRAQVPSSVPSAGIP